MGSPQEICLFTVKKWKKLQIWRQVLHSMTLCSWNPFCTWFSEKHAQKVQECQRFGKFNSALNPCCLIHKSSPVFSLKYHSTVRLIQILHVRWSCTRVMGSVGQLGVSLVYLHLFDGCLASKVVSDLQYCFSIVCCITYIPWGILGIYFCSWVCFVFWRGFLCNSALFIVDVKYLQ